MNVHIPTQLDQLSKKELLEVAYMMHEENIKLVSENKSLLEEIKVLEATVEWYMI